jgi:hypothetical protein
LEPGIVLWASAKPLIVFKFSGVEYWYLSHMLHDGTSSYWKLAHLFSRAGDINSPLPFLSMR